MRPLVDREQELERLLEQRDSAPSLVVMRGRRRVGKTFLLTHAFNGENVVSYQADEQRTLGAAGRVRRGGGQVAAGDAPPELRLLGCGL